MEAPVRGASPPPAGPLQGTSQHILVATTDEAYFIVSWLAPRGLATIIQIDPYSGSLFHLGHWGRDLFPSLEAAKSFLSSSAVIANETQAYALLGYLVADEEAYLVIATKIKEQVTLPGGHSVYSVVDSRAARIPLWRSFAEAQPTQSRPHAELLRSFPFENAHYYSETCDVTLPFPSPPVLQHNFASEFCWNGWLTESFASAGLREWCVCLVQGIAIGRLCQPQSATFRLAEALRMSGGQPRPRSSTGQRERSNTNSGRNSLHIALFTRRSRLNPVVTGGLNDDYEPANETEYELIGWTERPELRETHWASFVWRSGTAPLHWTVEQPVAKSAAYSSFSYTENVQSTGEPSVIVRVRDPHEGADVYFQRLADRYDALESLTLFNLLCKKLPAETLLSNALHDCVHAVRAKLNINAEIVDFDWTQSVKRDGPNATVEALWAQLKPALAASRLTLGQTSLIPPSELPNQPAAVAGRIASRQSTYLRFNSFDSANRASVAMLFVAYQVVAEISRMLGISSVSPHELHALQTQRWPYLEMGIPVERINEIASRPALDAVLELFQSHSDVVSLFCAQPSLATFLSSMTTQPGSGPSPAPNRTGVPSKRQRSEREKVLASEAVLGLRRDLLSSTLNEAHTQLVSGYPSFALLPLYASSPSACPFTQLHTKFSWHSATDNSTVELSIYLRRPCTPTEVVLTVPTEETDNFPLFMDICCADYVENAQILLQKVQLPRAEKGARLFYSLPSRTERMQANHLYKFHDDTSAFQRIIHFIFYAQPGCPISLGRVDVLGVVAQAPRSAQETLASLQQRELGSKVRRLASALGTPTPGRESDEAPTPLLEPFPISALEAPAVAQAQRTAASILPVLGLQPCDAERQYVRQVQESVRKDVKPPISFLQALRIDLSRLLLGLSAAQRDLILLRMGLSIDALNPGLFVFHRDEKEEAARRKAANTKTGKCYNCSAALGIFSFKGATQCTACYQYFCQQCLSPAKKRIIEFMWAKPYPVCKKCANILTEEEDLLCQIQGLIAKQKHAAQSRRMQDTLLTDLLMANVDCAAPRRALYLGKEEETTMLPLLRYPSAGLIRVTPTHPASPPAETLLFPEETTAPGVFWHTTAPSADIFIALATRAAVCRVGVQAGPLGFIAEDAPLLVVSAGDTAASMQPIGEWRLAKDGGRATPIEWREFTVDPPVVCRMLLFSLTLPPTAAEQGKRLHATRLMACGRPVPLAPIPMPSSPSRVVRGVQHLRAKEDIVEPISINTRNARRCIDITIALQAVAGFQLLVKHSDEGPSSQARFVRVSAHKDNEETVLGVYAVPLVHSPSLLSWCFDSPQTFSQWTFQFTTTYGGKQDSTAPHKVYLFSVSDK